jgi:hypothetical protein
MQRASNQREQDMTEGHFIAVPRPSRAEGIGRALQAAFRDGFQLPADLQNYLERLDRIRC